MSAVNQTEFDDNEHDLPHTINLRSGGKFEPKGDYWSFQDGVHRVYFDFETIPHQLKAITTRFKQVLINVLEELSPWTAFGMFRIYRHLAKVIEESETSEVQEINEKHLLNFISKYGVDDKLGMESSLGTLISKWTSLGYHGFSPEAVDLIKSRRKKGVLKGESVRTMDPVKGPFTEIELQEFIRVLNQSYAEKKIKEDFYFLAWLAILTGQRVSQFCMLKVCDLEKVQDVYGKLQYQLKIPTAKKRNEASRDSFLVRPLPPEFGQPFWFYVQKAREKNLDLGDRAPIFNYSKTSKAPMQLNSKFEGHWDVVSLCHYFDKEMVKISPISLRTLEPMHIAIGRFRKTLGTRAAQEGFGALVIAEMLGHEDTQNVKVYVGIVPEIAHRLNEQLARDLAPIANAFLGKVIRTSQDATRVGEQSGQIIDYKYAKSGVGSCGTYYDCKFNAPIACYTCRNFEAWADAPHHELLEHLLSERERLWKTSGQRIACQNDSVILGVQAVIIECENLKRQQKALNG